ncbi:hypothetical protein ACJX0J_017751, partial [Zea mays]
MQEGIGTYRRTAQRILQYQISNVLIIYPYDYEMKKNGDQKDSPPLTCTFQIWHVRKLICTDNKLSTRRENVGTEKTCEVSLWYSNRKFTEK